MQTTKTTTDNLFGENLKYYLEKENISQRKFAKLVGTTPATVNRWITGKRQPHLSKITKIANVLDVTIEQLVSAF